MRQVHYTEKLFEYPLTEAYILPESEVIPVFKANVSVNVISSTFTGIQMYSYLTVANTVLFLFLLLFFFFLIEAILSWIVKPQTHKYIMIT